MLEHGNVIGCLTDVGDRGEEGVVATLDADVIAIWISKGIKRTGFVQRGDKRGRDVVRVPDLLSDRRSASEQLMEFHKLIAYPTVVRELGSLGEEPHLFTLTFCEVELVDGMAEAVDLH